MSLLREPCGCPSLLGWNCHWSGKYEAETDDQQCLVSFDLSTMLFFTTQISSDIMDDDTVLDFRFLRRHLLVLNGSIALVSNYTKAATVCISILGQVGLKKLWTKLFMLGPYPMHQGSCGSQKKGGIFFRKKDDQLVWLILAPRRFRSLVSKEER